MEKKIHRTMIGGQAVIEGVMMRGPSRMAVAVRKPDGSIDLDVQELGPIGSRYPALRLPIVRGVVNFVGMLVNGYRTLMRSAEVSGMVDAEDGEEAGSPAAKAPPEDAGEAVPEKSGAAEEAALAGALNDPAAAEAAVAAEEAAPGEPAPENAESAVTAESPAAEPEGPGAGEAKAQDREEGGLSAGMGVLSMVLGLAIAVVLFTVIPTFLVGRTDALVHWGGTKTIVEGLIKIAMFVAYLAVISSMKDIQRVYQYHGAEHKTIYCYEHGEELTPTNARRYTRFHPRCGTSFLLIVLIVSIIVFSVVTWKELWLRIVLKLVLLPVVVGISYEIIRFVGRHDNSFLRFILAPGLWLQRLTTREPDDSQLECAIAAIKAVLPGDGEDDRW